MALSLISAPIINSGKPKAIRCRTRRVAPKVGEYRAFQIKTNNAFKRSIAAARHDTRSFCRRTVSPIASGTELLLDRFARIARFRCASVGSCLPAHVRNALSSLRNGPGWWEAHVCQLARRSSRRMLHRHAIALAIASSEGWSRDLWPIPGSPAGTFLQLELTV